MVVIVVIVVVVVVLVVIKSKFEIMGKVKLRIGAKYFYCNSCDATLFEPVSIDSARIICKRCDCRYQLSRNDFLILLQSVRIRKIKECIQIEQTLLKDIELIQIDN